MKRLIMTLIFVFVCSTAYAQGVVIEKTVNSVGNVLGLVVDTTNETHPTTAYYYLPIVQKGYNTFSAQHKITDYTITYEGSNDLPNVDNATADWSDITDMLSDGTVTSFTSDGYLSVNVHIPWSRIRIKRETVDATNECEIRITRTNFR